MWQNSKAQIVTLLKNSNCDNSNSDKTPTQIETKIKDLNCGKKKNPTKFQN